MTDRYLILKPRDGADWQSNKDALKRMGAFYVAERRCWLFFGLPDDIPRKTATLHGDLELGKDPGEIPRNILVQQIDKAANFMEDCR